MKITLNKSQTYFTSDPHYGHANIILYVPRPFRNVDEMNEELIKRYNEVVPVDGHCFILGDVAFTKSDEAVEILHSLNGTKYLISGNHDKELLRSDAFRACFASIHSMLDLYIKDDDRRLVLCHYAMRVWDQQHRGAYQLYGHSHGSMPDDGSRSMDVGVDTHAYRPYTYQEIKDKLGQRRVVPFDGHKERT